jgi:hypothetical protein
VSAGYALSPGSLRGVGLEQVVEAALQRRWEKWIARARAGFTRATVDNTALSISQTELRMALGAGWALQLGPAELTLGLEGQLMQVHQKLRGREEEPLLAGQQPTLDGSVWSAGPFVAAGLPLSERFQLEVELATDGTRIRPWHAEPYPWGSVQVHTNLGWAF